MTKIDAPAKARDLSDVLGDLRFAMVGTADHGTWKSRPLTLNELDGNAMRFLVSSTADWVGALEAERSPTTVTFSDPQSNTYVAVQGQARTIDNRAMIERLWSPGAAAFFDGKDDPTVRVLEVNVTSGEWWDGPSGRVGQMLAMVKAAVGADAGGTGPIAT